MLRAVPRGVSYDGSFDEMPLSVRRAASVSRDFYTDALCRTVNDEIRFFWIADPRVRYGVGSQMIMGSVLNELALETCRLCPVQWECAITAIDADESAGVWGELLDYLRRVRNERVVIERARAEGVPVSVAVRRHLGVVS